MKERRKRRRETEWKVARCKGDLSVPGWTNGIYCT